MDEHARAALRLPDIGNHGRSDEGDTGRAEGEADAPQRHPAAGVPTAQYDREEYHGGHGGCDDLVAAVGGGEAVCQRDACGCQEG